MSNLVSNVIEISKKYNRQIKKSTEILSPMGISYFATQKISREGYWSIISNQVDWLEYSAGNHFYKNDPSLIDPRNYTSGIGFMSAHQNKDFRHTIQKHAEDYFDLGNCLAIVEKNQGDCYFTFFATAVENTKIINTYITKIEFLKNFVVNFRQAHKNLFGENLEYQLDLKQINSDAYYKKENIAEIASENIEPTSHLSPREKEILQYFLKGKTSKETANILNLSYRTIEDYFENLKQKLGCRYKRDLLGIFKREG